MEDKALGLIICIWVIGALCSLGVLGFFIWAIVQVLNKFVL